MTTREPKTRTFTTVEVIGRNAVKKGTLELTSGNIIFSRRYGEETLKLTYQQLIELFEKEVAYRMIEISKRMPKGRTDGNDFTINAYENDEESGDGRTLVQGACPLARMESKRMNEGGYDIDFGLAKGRQTKNRFWFARISVQTVLTILDYYIDRTLVRTTDRKEQDANVVISRPQMRDVLLRLLKKLDY